MSNALYDKGRNKFARGDLKWLASGGDTIKAALLKATHSPNLAAHEWWSDVSADVVGTPEALNLIDPVAGVVDANDVTFAAVTGDQVGFVVIYKDTGVAGTSPLIALIDTATGLPVTPNGGNIQIQWDDGANKIFKL
ncbi:MAG: hypothetical protein AB1491_04800 [Thermodesulfobacteriota bacterium]